MKIVKIPKIRFQRRFNLPGFKENQLLYTSELLLLCPKNETNNTLMNDFDRNVFEMLENIQNEKRKSIAPDINAQVSLQVII